MKGLLIFLIFVLVGAAGGFYYILQTTRGLKDVTAFVLDRLVKAEVKTVKSVEGTLLTTARFKNIELKNLQGLHHGTVIRIQELTVHPHGLNYKNARIEISNARLKLPVSENIVVNATADRQNISADVFSPLLDVEEVLGLAAGDSALLKSFKGTLKRCDFHIQGTFRQPQIAGHLHIDELSRPDLILKDTPAVVQLSISVQKPVDLKGEISVEKGTVKARQTDIELKPSRIYFSGDPRNPALAVEAYSVIELLEITILVKGTLEKPQLTVSSDPPLPYEEIMVTLATGRRWEGFEGLEQGQVSPELTREFLGYLLFPESGDGFLQRLGISNVKLTLEGDKKGLGFRKEISDRLDVDYELEQTGANTGQQSTSQTVGADYRVSNAFFATVERRRQIMDGLNTTEPGAADDRILMKYKTRF